MDFIKIQIHVKAPVDKVWDYFTNPKHITQWNFAHESWQCPKAEVDLKNGGSFSYRMDAKDGSFGFDLNGVFDEVKPNDLLKYHLEDGRKVEVDFKSLEDGSTEIIEQFQPEQENPTEFQEHGWQAILNSFKNYTELH